MEINNQKQDEFVHWLKQHVIDTYGEGVVFTLVVLTEPAGDTGEFHYVHNVLAEEVPQFLAVAASSANNAG